MKYVTRKLLKFRPGSEYVGPVEFRDRGREPRECMENANSEFVENGHQPVPGWVVSPRDEVTGNTLIIRHFWNQDPEGRYYDTTPFGVYDHSEYDYVKDWEVYATPERLRKEGYFKDKQFISSPNMIYHEDRFVIEDLTQVHSREVKKAAVMRGNVLWNWFMMSIPEEMPMSIEEIIQAGWKDEEFLREKKVHEIA